MSKKIISLLLIVMLISVLIPSSVFAEDVEKLRAKFDEIEARLPVLQDLLSQCRDKGIPTDYETISYTIIKNFIQYGRDDINHGFLSRAEYVAEELKTLHNEAINNLKAYLKGEKKPFEVPRYVTGVRRPEIKGYSFIADTEMKKIGGEIVRERRPVFFIGYGHFTQVRVDIPQFFDYGKNIIQIEIGPWSVVFPPTPEDIKEGRNFSISTDKIKEDIIIVLEKAEKNNIAVNLLLSPHYFPGWALERWPELRNACPYNINAPKARKIIEAFLRTIIPLIKDYESLHSLTLSNEPAYDTRLDPFAVDVWHEFLRGEYKNIDNLNEAYGTNFASFEEVGMPVGADRTVHFYDWIVFNNKNFSGWHRWMANIIHEMAPELPLHTKLPGANSLDSLLVHGIDVEDFAQFCDINGNDTVNYLGGGPGGFLRRNMLYDLQRLLRKAPVFDSEDHIIPDRDTRCVPEQVPHVYSTLWQGAVHGRSASTIWVWERMYDVRNDLAGSVMHRPDVVRVVGKVNLDLNRLAHEVTALQNTETHVAILYSVPSLVYSPRYLQTVDVIYESLTFNGQRGGFISERQIQAGKLPEFKALVIPNATHVKTDTLRDIKDFVAQGRKVVIIGDDSLSRDERNKELSASDREYIFNHSTVLRAPITRRALREKIPAILKKLGLLKVTLIDTATGEPVYGVAWLSTVYNNKFLVNICNYADSAKNLLIKVDGKPVDGFKELISGKSIESAEILAETRNPLLLSIAQ